MKIVVLDRYSLGLDTPFEALSDLGDVVFYDNSDENEAISRITDADVIIVNKVKVSEKMLSSAKNLKLVCVFATGYDNIDIRAARLYGVAVCNVPGYSTDSVALYTVTTALALYSHLNEYNDYVKSGEYSSSGVPNKLTPVYHELQGKIWGIVGYGNIGRAVADVAKAFGARVVVNKRTPVKDAECVDIDTLCKISDIISIHCPLNEDSRLLINEERLNMMKQGVVLVNEARGAVLDEYAVTKAVETGKIGGFGCDVYTTEPFSLEHPYNRIMNFKNVILTPHCAWGSYESRERCINIIAENIRAFFDGKTQNRVDK